MTMGKVFCDGNRFIEAAFWGKKQGELASHVNGLVFFGGNGLGVNNTDGELFASMGSDSSSTESEEVEWIVDVDLLNKG